MNEQVTISVPQKILVIQTAFIGDVILTTPLISALKKCYSNALIDFLTIPKSVDILKNNPHLNRILVFDKNGRDKGISGLRRMAREIKAGAYDLCITPHRSLRSAYLTKSTNAGRRIGFDRLAWKWALTDIVRYRYDFHEIVRNLSLLRPLGYEIDISRPEIFPGADDQEQVDRIFSEKGLKHGMPLFALAPGSVWPTKRWPVDYFISMGQSLVNDGFTPLLIGGKEDQLLCDQITENVSGSISLAGKLSLRQSALVLRSCLALLTNDSAPLHLGLAAGIPVYALFGSTVPEFGFAPFTKIDKIIEDKQLKCRPCGNHGKNKCPIKTFECMLGLHPEKVYQITDPKSLLTGINR